MPLMPRTYAAMLPLSSYSSTVEFTISVCNSGSRVGESSHLQKACSVSSRACTEKSPVITQLLSGPLQLNKASILEITVCLRDANDACMVGNQHTKLHTHLSKMRRSLPSCTFLSTAIVSRNCSTVMFCISKKRSV